VQSEGDRVAARGSAVDVATRSWRIRYSEAGISSRVRSSVNNPGSRAYRTAANSNVDVIQVPAAALSQITSS
jgi:hypothetical protein